MRGATVAHESLRMGANPENNRHILLSFVTYSEVFHGGPGDRIGFQDLHNLIFDINPEAY